MLSLNPLEAVGACVLVPGTLQFFQHCTGPSSSCRSRHKITGFVQSSKKWKVWKNWGAFHHTWKALGKWYFF